MYKNCKRCNIEKETIYFCKNQSKKDGLEIYCKECNREYKKKHYIKNKKIISEKHKIYYLENKQTIIEKVKEYTDDNKEFKKEYFKEYYLKNKENIIEKVKEYNIKNKEFKKDYFKLYSKNRKEKDPLYKLSINIRNSILYSLKNKGYVKESKTNQILGCSFEEFKIYIESKFETWMNWNNHGLYNGELNYGWDIDHTIPLSSANTEEEILRLNHYNNLQPLCSYTNRYIKKDNINYVQ